MKIKYLLCVLCCCMPIRYHAQQSVDSLQLEQWSDTYAQLFKTEPKRAISELIQISDSLIEHGAHPIEKSWMLYEVVKFSFRHSLQDTALVYARKGLRHTPSSIEEDRAGFYNIIGAIYSYNGQRDSAAYYMTEAATILEKYGDALKAGYVQNNIGTIYFDEYNFDVGLSYMLEAERLMGNDSTFLTTVVGNISYAYGQLDSFDQADSYADRAIEMSKILDRPNGYIYGYLTKADIASKRDGDTDLAIKHSLRAYHRAQRVKDDYRASLAAANLYKLYKAKDMGTALEYGEEAYRQYLKDQPRFAHYLAYDLSQSFNHIGNNQKAYHYLHYYTTYLDSLKKKEYTEIQLDLLNKYEAEKKQKIIAEQANAITRESFKNSRLLFIAIVLGLLCLLALAYYLYKKKLHDSQLMIMRRDQEMKVMQSVLQGEHKERKRLSKELHDGLANNIAATKMFMAAHEDHEDMGKMVMKQLDALHAEARSAAHDLLPKSFMYQGFISFVEDYAAEMSTIIPIHLDIKSYRSNKTSSFEYWLLRIIQETVGNALRHSKAKRIDVAIEDDGRTITLGVKDDGIGFDDSSDRKHLSYLKSRIHDLKGTISVDTGHGHGTEIRINVDYEI